MASPARQIANISNAQLSTGPRTEEGKNRSSQNARKHGLTAAQLVIAAEDREEFEALHAQLTTEIKPHGALQQLLFNELVEQELLESAVGFDLGCELGVEGFELFAIFGGNDELRGGEAVLARVLRRAVFAFFGASSEE